MIRGRNTSFVVALGVAVAIGAAGLAMDLPLRLSVEAAANGLFLAYLVQSATGLRRLTADYLRKHANAQDQPASVILLVTVIAVAAATGSLFSLINAKPSPDVIEMTLGLSSVLFGWATIHTMAAFHYAHLFWDDTPEPRGGLEFPSTPKPGGYDFLYFAFVIGMTAQTSDVQITSTAMRRISVLHGIVSFLFNTVILAAAVNFAVSLQP